MSTRHDHSRRMARIVRWSTNGAAALVAGTLAVHGLEAGDGISIVAAVVAALLGVGADRVATDFARADREQQESAR